MDDHSALIEALGWTLLHFLWQGAVVGVFLWLLLLAGKRLTPPVRYTAAALALTAMVIWPAVTFLRQDRAAPALPMPAEVQAVMAPPSLTAPLPAVSIAASAAPVADTPGPVEASVPPPVETLKSASPPPAPDLRDRLRAVLPWLVGAWALGVFLFSLRFFVGWRMVERTRRSGAPPEDEAWMARLESLKARMKISRPVTILVSATSAVPMVIGWLKPVVLVPAGMCLGLSARQLEAILAHELAHIRRHDYLVNLLQAAVEAVFFYHPAVWWASAQMRKEREHCCDDIASSITGSSLEYARALTALEEIRGMAAAPAGAVSATGGSLLGRVRRLLGVPQREPGTAAPWIFGLAGMLVAVLALSGMRAARGSQADATDTRAKETAEPRAEDVDQSAAGAENAADAAPDIPGERGLAPVTDGVFMAQVLYVPGHEPVVILTKRAFTVSADSTTHSGSITLPVNTSAKTETIAYTWPEATPGVIDLKVGAYPVSRFDLSRGRVFFVHFETLEFSADVFQVPAEVKVPVISSPETLTQAAESVTEWYAQADDRALWECSRVIVPESEVKVGQPLDAAAETIVWGEPNDVGLRLGLGGLEPGAAVPVGQQLPIKQYIRNDGAEPLTFSPTQIFNEGVDGELVRASDGAKIPHRKGYRWQSFFERVRLAPGHYIALGSAPMRTFMAEKDGSSSGDAGMLDHGFAVLPGDYSLQLTHGIGQFLGRPVNFNFGDPRGAPGLGEWTGILKSAPLPLRLVDQEVRSARPGGSEAFGRKYKIDFENGALKLRHYNGYPKMSRTGAPWEADSRDWNIKAADGDYLVAWAVGAHGIWVKHAEGITHLIVKDTLTETGHWTLEQAAGGIDPMPAGIREAFSLPPPPAPQAFDFRMLPMSAGPARIDGPFFEMRLPADEAVLKVPHGRKEFFVEYQGNTYGPAEGNPVVELGLTDILRKKLAETPNAGGLATLEAMIRQGRGAIRDCAFHLLAELKAPQAPFDYDALFGAMINASIETEDGPKELSAEGRTAYTYFWNLFHETRRTWERTRPLLAADRYRPGEKLAGPPAIAWTTGPDGLSLGVSGLPDGASLEIGESVPLAVYLRNDSPAAVRLSVPSEHNPVLQISVIDAQGVKHPATYRFSSGVTGYQHHRLEPGEGVQVASVDLESYATADEAGSADHKEGREHNPRLAVPTGRYALHLEYRNYQENPVPKGSAAEWTGKLTAQPVTVRVEGAAEAGAAAPAPTIRGLNLAGLPQRDDLTAITELYEPRPDKPGESRQKPNVFFMSLGTTGPWLYYAAGADHFFLEVRHDPGIVKDVICGPIDGHPTEKLDLAGWLKESPAHSDPGYARRVARDMLASGDEPLAALALGWLGEFTAPSPPDEHDGFIAAIEKHLAQNPRSSEADRARAVLTRLKAMASIASAEWEMERKVLPDEGYGAGEPLETLTAAVQWGDPAANGLRLGLAGPANGEKWLSGSERTLEIYLRNYGDEPVKFSWTPRTDEGLDLLLTDGDGHPLQASIVGWAGPLIRKHCRLDPGHFLKLKPHVAFRILEADVDGTSPGHGSEWNSFLVEAPGIYRFEAICRIGLRDWADSRGNKWLRPAGEWEGTLMTPPVEVIIGDAGTVKVVRKDATTVSADSPRPLVNANPYPYATRTFIGGVRTLRGYEYLSGRDRLPMPLDRFSHPFRPAFGPAREDGLQAAWVLDPRKTSYHVGEIVQCRVLFRNSGKESITFETDAWHQFDTWRATDAAGNTIEAKTTWFSGLTRLEKVVLGPGEVKEISAHGVGIGLAEYAEATKLGCELWAKEGDEVTCVWDVQVSPSSTERLRTGPVRFKVTAPGEAK